MNKLNENIWKNSKRIDSDVKERLLNVAKIFLKNIETPIEIKNIFFTGSLATYVWNNLSDIDLHIIVDVLDEKCMDTVSDYFDTRSKIFNKEHDIFIRGYKVEVNIKTEETELTGKAIYDLIKDEWYIKPIKPTRTMDDHEVLTLVSRIQYEIEDAINNRRDIDVLKDLRKKIKKIRVDGLKEEGEYSVGNLTFKSLRNSGYIKRLIDHNKEIQDDMLSLESFKDYLYR
jgi:hypothetical protein